MKPDNSYQLLLRYQFQPETINPYQISIKPYWWQTIVFRIGIVSFLLSLISWYILRANKRKHKRTIALQKEELDTAMLKLKTIRLQLNPHFLFNSLSSIQSLINNNEIKAANEYLSEFGNLMRSTLDNSDKIYNELSKELDLLETYLKLERLRFCFHYTLQIDSTVNVNDIEIPSLLLQPLAENAVKHGVSSLRDKGIIEISITQDQENLIILITDNGKGIAENMQTGYGLQLTEDRIRLLNQVSNKTNISKQFLRENDKTIVKLIFENWL